MNLLDVVLIVVLMVSLLTDLKYRRIYNKVLFPAVLIALVGSFYDQGFEGLVSSFTGLLLGIGLLLIPYLMGGMGAGDVKLLGVIGAFKGSWFVFYAFLYTAIIGGVMALAILVWQRKWHKKIGFLLLSLWWKRQGLDIPVTFSRAKSTELYPYGVAIVFGVFLTVGIRGW